MGGFLTATTSPTFTGREGFTFTLLMVTRPFLHASAAIDLVLKMRAAHSHLSILASMITVSPYLFLLNVFIVKSTPDKTKLLIISHAVSIFGVSTFISSSLYFPSTH